MMRWQTGALTLLVASLLALAGLWAQGEKRVTIELKDAPLADAFDQLFRAAGENFILLPGVPKEQRLTMRLADVPFEKALNFLCDLAELKWERKDGVYLISSHAPRAGIVGGAFALQPMFAIPEPFGVPGAPAGVPGGPPSSVPLPLHVAPIEPPMGLPLPGFAIVPDGKPAIMCTRCRQIVTRSCPQCRRGMDFSWQFCPYDGTKLPPAPTKCPKCGTPLPLPKAPTPPAPPKGK